MRNIIAQKAAEKEEEWEGEAFYTSML